MKDVATTTSLFERLGGAPAIRAVVDAFYEAILGDETLAPFFEDTDWNKQKAHQAAFIGAALGGPESYDGKGMREAHEGRGIEDQHFDAVAGHLVATLQSVGVGQDLIDEVVGRVAPLRGEVVGH